MFVRPVQLVQHKLDMLVAFCRFPLKIFCNDFVVLRKYRHIVVIQFLFLVTVSLNKIYYRKYTDIVIHRYFHLIVSSHDSKGVLYPSMLKC